MSISEERVWQEDCLRGTSLLTATYRDQSFARHVHDTYVVGVDTGGLSSTWYQGEDRTVTPGHLLVLNPGEVQTGTQLSDEPWSCRVSYPTVELLQELLREVTGGGWEVPSFPRMSYPDQDLVRSFLTAHRSLERHPGSSEGETRMLEFFIALLDRHAEPRSVRSMVRREPVVVRKVMDYIRDRLDQPLELTELADVAGYSRYHFLRLFSETVGMTPHAYVMQQRIDQAKRLVRSGRALADTAFSCGFTDQSHLTRRFKAFVGVTPGEFARGCR